MRFGRPRRDEDREPAAGAPRAERADPGATGAATGVDRADWAAEAARSPTDSVVLRRVRRDRSLLSLLELSHELNVRMDVYEIADVAMFNLLGHFGCARGALWVLPERAGEAVLLRSQGLGPSTARGLGAVWTTWLASRPGGLTEPVTVKEFEKVAPASGVALAQDAGIALFAPVSARRQMLGLIAVGHRVDGAPFESFEREVLQASVNFLGVALENANLYNRAMENHRQLRQAFEHLQEADRLKSEFLRNLNHELRTPLTVMSAYLESLLGMEVEESDRKRLLDVLRGESDRLQGMVMNLLDFSKLLRDELETRPERGELRPVLEGYHAERTPGVNADLRELRCSAATNVPPALFDREALVRVLDCLVDNAVKFTPPGTVIHLRADGGDAGDEGVRIEVEDDGPGIPAERLPHVFDAFRQGDGSETRERGGLGVGLAFAKELVESMEGTIEVRSEVGRGTCFTIRLPAA